jgi:hypothetical protein
MRVCEASTCDESLLFRVHEIVLLLLREQNTQLLKQLLLFFVREAREHLLVQDFLGDRNHLLINLVRSRMMRERWSVWNLKLMWLFIKLSYGLPLNFLSLFHIYLFNTKTFHDMIDAYRGCFDV